MEDGARMHCICDATDRHPVIILGKKYNLFFLLWKKFELRTSVLALLCPKKVNVQTYYHNVQIYYYYCYHKLLNKQNQ